jgi:flagellar FliL protein
MADAAADAAPPLPKKTGGFLGMLAQAIGIFVLTLGAVVAGGFINAALHPLPDLQLDKDGKIKAIAPVAAPAREAAIIASAALYYSIDPPLVVNFEEGSAVRFLQISMEIMAHDQKAIDSVQKNVPLIRNNLLLLMSNRDAKDLMSREGKEQLRHEALEEVRAVQKRTGGPDVDDVLFTSFVVQ